MTERFPAANRRAVLRRFILSHRIAAAALIALALALKLVVPAGFITVPGAGQMMVLVCTEFGPQRVAIDVPGAPGKPGDKAKADQPCAFAGLSQAMMAGADPMQLAAALAFVLAIGLTAIAVPAVPPVRHAWPPLRGPPPAP